MPSALQTRTLKSAALVGSGLAAYSRTRRSTEVAILTFHGICEEAGIPEILDWSLHLPVAIFRSVCERLARDYHVIPLGEMVVALAGGGELPPNAVVITFDDGYASNYELAWPVLREMGLPATIFATTGFLDGEDMLWFQRVDLALGRTEKPQLEWKINDRRLRMPLGTRAQRQRALVRLMPELKELPDTDLLGEVDRLEDALEVPPPKSAASLPAPMRPLTWDMARELTRAGLVEIGGHTHTHPILSRCEPLVMRAEINTCRDRLRAELGRREMDFAYPNGGPEDYNRESVRLVREAGFRSACTLINGRVDAEAGLFQLPRYGSPESVLEAEATVSGAFETLKEWRRSCLRAMSLV